MAPLPAEKARDRKNDIGSIGSRTLSSQATNAANSRTPVVSAATTSKEPQPAWLPRTSPHTTPNAPPETSASPPRSSAESGPWLSLILVSTNGIATSPIGTFTQKIHSQLIPSTTAPPISGPLATERPVIALKIPIAAPRFSAGNAALSSARPRVMTSAAPAPWTARPAISHPMPGASAQAAEETVKRASPAAYSLRRPYRSPTRPR